MAMNRRLATALAILVAAIVVAAIISQTASGDDRATQSTPTVSIKDDFFSPKTKSISRGGSVKWNWRGSDDHDVTFSKVPKGAGKRSSTTKSSGTFQRAFTKSGTYRYICTVHVDNGMRGTVKVD